MSNDRPQYIFSGHAIGAAARFHRLDDAHDLNYAVPTLGASVLAATGGRSEARAALFRYAVDFPRRRSLLSAERVESWVEGRGGENGVETELNVEVDSVSVLEKFYVGALRLHLLSIRKPGADPVVSTRGVRMDGMHLGRVEARLTLDLEPLTAVGTADHFAEWHKSRQRSLERGGNWLCASLVRSIELVGPEQERDRMTVEGHTIRWKGFGRIILGEIHVKGHERRVTLVRLAMGSDAGGDATIGEGQSNGTLPGG